MTLQFQPAPCITLPRRGENRTHSVWDSDHPPSTIR